MITKKRLSTTLVGVAIVLAAAFSPATAAPGAHGGHGFDGHGPSGHFDGHHGFEAHHGFDWGRHGGVFIGAPFGWYPDYGWPAYTYPPAAPSYWYYCQSYGAYYPTVPSCPEAWVPVPAQ
jgi:hypothetical protein